MVIIKKNVPPNSLVAHKNKSFSSYDNFEQKDDIRKSLLSEQFSLCAYCMGKIQITSMKIEHFKCQAKYPSLELDYNNMLGCCTGNENKPQKMQTCDTKKGDMELLFNPSNPSDYDKLQIAFLDDGTIFSRDEKFDEQLNTVLNLNTEQLKHNRKDILDAVKQILGKKTGTRTKTQIQKLINAYREKRKPYYYVAVYYLEKKLKTAK